MRWLGLVAAWVMSGCLDLREFPSESLVREPRILAVVAEPPEVTPGAALEITPLVVRADEIEIRYRICAGFDAPFGGGQYGEEDQENCDDRALLTGSGPSWTLPAEASTGLWSNRDLAETVLGGALPRETIDAVRYAVGVPLLVELTVQADGRELRAVKRVLFSENPTPHQNPPPPEFSFGKTEVRADADAPWACSGSEPLRAKPGTRIEIAPSVRRGREPWVEPYHVINSRGELESRTERAYYSWFSTGGEFESHVTRAPLRNQVWTAPTRPGRYQLWLVVRDGHGGASACGVDVRVES